MSRTKISEYSATAADNTDINAINIAEGCAPSGINNAIREMMKQLKDFQAGTAGDSLSVGGNLSYTGTLTGSTGILNIGSGQIYKDASGNVGVGTATPSAVGSRTTINIKGSDGAAIRLSDDTSNTFIDYTDGSGARISVNAAEPLILQTNSLERMRITSAGNVGIGTSSPGVFGVSARNITVANTAGYGYLQLQGSSLNGGAIDFGDTSIRQAEIASLNGSALAFYTNPTNSGNGITERMRIDSAGNVGIGTSSPAQRLSVSGTASSLVSLISSTTEANIRFDNSTASNAFFGTTGGANFFWFSGGTERARIDSSGNLLVGTTSNGPGDGNTNTGNSITASGQAFHSGSGGRVLILNRNTSNGIIQVFHREGLLVGNISVTTTATTYNTSSDQRLKENIVDAPSASDSIDAIQIRSFDWKADGSHQKYGVIAQELEAIAPEAVSKGEKEDDMWGVDYSKLVPMLIKEVQSLRARVAQLEGN